MQHVLSPTEMFLSDVNQEEQEVFITRRGEENVLILDRKKK
jgi:PHD/YefM family antitoxin component YafN of YafNO toxin-antitoxin module